MAHDSQRHRNPLAPYRHLPGLGGRVNYYIHNTPVSGETMRKAIGKSLYYQVLKVAGLLPHVRVTITEADVLMVTASGKELLVHQLR